MTMGTLIAFGFVLYLAFCVGGGILSGGRKKRRWLRVRSNRANHINLAQYLKKGKLLLVEGVLGEPEIWEDKQHVQHVQLSIVADSITFISTGKKKEEVKSEDTSTPPTDAPAPSDEDLPF